MPADLTKAQVEEMFKKADEDKRPAEQAFKNIQVLKGVNAGRVLAYMRLFTKDLGVKCSLNPDAHRRTCARPVCAG